jgi:predicted ArsR family transcriptional regulator
MTSMSSRSGEAATHHALSGESRQALLGVLRRHGRPIDAAAAAEAVGLHRNTARVHLDVLVSVGLVTRSFEDRTTRGRPRVLYAAARPGAEGAGHLIDDAGYRVLARLLADQLAEVAYTSNEAMRAGRRWAAGLDGSSTAEAATPAEAVAVAVQILDGLGFDPEPDPEDDPVRILLHRCPFSEVARENRSVICGIHLGMLKATFERLNTSLEVAGLDSFVRDDPLLCVVRLATKSAPDARPRLGRSRSEKS